MRHDWVFDVLRDLKAYAQANGLSALALKADEALHIARAEIVAQPAPDSSADPDNSAPSPPGRAH